MKSNAIIVKACLIVFVLALASGCGWFGSKESPDSQAFDTPAQVLANEAESLYNEGEYEDAAELFQALKDQHPYSRFALLADLRVGDAYYKSERYEEAILAYDDFIRLHPKNEAVPYAMFQMGMVWYTQMLTVDRDPTFAQKAAATFQRLMKTYPKDEWAHKAEPRLFEAQQRRAAHDMFVGDFYLRTKKYRAAAGRFRRVLTSYPDVGLYAEALDKLEISKKYLADAGEEEEVLDRGINRTDLESPLPADDLTQPPVSEDTGGLDKSKQ